MAVMSLVVIPRNCGTVAASLDKTAAEDHCHPHHTAPFICETSECCPGRVAR